MCLCVGGWVGGGGCNDVWKSICVTVSQSLVGKVVSVLFVQLPDCWFDGSLHVCHARLCVSRPCLYVMPMYVTSIRLPRAVFNHNVRGV